MLGVVRFASRPESCSGRLGIFALRISDDSVVFVERAELRYFLRPYREDAGRTRRSESQPAPDDRSDPPRRHPTRVLLTETGCELVRDVLDGEPFARASSYEIPYHREDLRFDALRSLLR